LLADVCAHDSAAESVSLERAALIFRHGEPLTLLGPSAQVGAQAPSFSLQGADGAAVELEQFAGKMLVLSVLPSLDTPVCEAQTGRLARAYQRFPSNTELLTVSRDLPFAQRRFAEIKAYPGVYASDARDQSFGKSWGLGVKETGLLARSVWVIAPGGRIIYAELVSEQSSEPNYDALFAAIPGLAPEALVQEQWKLELDCASATGFRATGFPLISESGLIAHVYSAQDGARGAANLTLSIFRPASTAPLFGQVTLLHPEEELDCDRAQTLLRARLALAQSHLAGQQWRPMRALTLLNDEGGSVQHAVLDQASELELVFASPFLLVRSVNRHVAAVSSLSEYAAALRYEDCVGANPMQLSAAWSDEEQLFLEIGYAGSDQCWEPDARYLSIALPPQRAEWGGCAALGGVCEPACDAMVALGVEQSECGAERFCCVRAAQPLPCALLGGRCSASCEPGVEGDAHPAAQVDAGRLLNASDCTYCCLRP
jgi:thiol peroxidase